MGIGDWGLGIGDWGLGVGANAQSPIPNPQSPIPNPQSPIYFNVNFKNYIVKINKNIKINKLYFKNNFFYIFF